MTSAVPLTDKSDLISRLTLELVSHPDVLAAYGRKLDSMVDQDKGFIQYLPRCVKKRLRALKKLQLAVYKVDEEFYHRVSRLETEFSSKNRHFRQERKDIICGIHEPTDEECDYESDDENECKNDDESDDEGEKEVGGGDEDLRVGGGEEKVEEKKLEVNSGEIALCVYPEETKGVPEFWLTIFRNVSLLNNLVQNHDLPLLRKLQDIRVERVNEGVTVGFELVFDFGENDYFEEKELRKKFIFRLGPDPEDAMLYEGPEIVSSSKCLIHWKKDKNITMKTKKVKRKSKKVVVKCVRVDSFFNFFALPRSKDSDECQDAEMSEKFEVAQVLKDTIIPGAVLYYTGIAFKDDDDESDEDDESSNSGDDDDDAQNRKKRKGSKTSNDSDTERED